MLDFCDIGFFFIKGQDGEHLVDQRDGLVGKLVEILFIELHA
jgi:hypothetical protein